MALNRYCTAEELSRELAEMHGLELSAERILELARLGYIPCATLDRGEILYFRRTYTKNWIAKHLIHEQEAKPFPKEIVTFDTATLRLDRVVPAELAPLRRLLCTVPMMLFRQTVIYFLVKVDRVVYVGKSENLLLRLAAHIQLKEFDYVYFLPVPDAGSADIEIAFIKALKPPLNRSRKPEGRDAEYAAILDRFVGSLGNGDATHATPSPAALGQEGELLEDGCQGESQILPGHPEG